MNRKNVISIVSALAVGAAILGSMPLIASADNPIPTTSSISPSSMIVGSSSFALTVNGFNFVPGSVVSFNGSQRPTTYLSSGQLTATIYASDVSSTGTFPVAVVNPLPGGGTSNAQLFTVMPVVGNPLPSMSSISPSSVVVGSSAFTLTVNGGNFIPASIARINGSDRATAYISANQVSATIPASDVSSIGSFNVSVVNPGPGGGTSNSMIFTVMPISINPFPSISSISPSTAISGSSALRLQVYGTNFNQSSFVGFNGISMLTTYISSNQVSAIIPASSLAVAGGEAVTVTNPAPGGGTSNAVLFTVTSQTPKLPNTGFGPTEDKSNQNQAALVFGGVLLALFAISLITARRIFSLKH